MMMLKNMKSPDVNYWRSGTFMFTTAITVKDHLGENCNIYANGITKQKTNMENKT